jgi:hypothetical protein
LTLQLWQVCSRAKAGGLLSIVMGFLVPLPAWSGTCCSLFLPAVDILILPLPSLPRAANSTQLQAIVESCIGVLRLVLEIIRSPGFCLVQVVKTVFCDRKAIASYITKHLFHFSGLQTHPLKCRHFDIFEPQPHTAASRAISVPPRLQRGRKLSSRTLAP